MKKYRVNGSEHFNLVSMYEHLKFVEEATPAENFTQEQWSEIYSRIEEIEMLTEKAYCVGALVDWQTLKRIREIQQERQFIRYKTCLSQGTQEREAAISFEL